MGLAGAAVAAPGLPSAAADVPAGPRRTRWSGATSSNGWPVLSPGSPLLVRTTIEGTPTETVLRAGPVATVLTHVVRRLAYELTPLRAGEVGGHTADRLVSTPAESTYLSGTGVAVRPGSYPAGARDGLLPSELAVVRDVLAECRGVVRWGGDDDLPKESHFQIAVGPGDPGLTALASELGGWRGRGADSAGAPPDVFDPSRRAAAALLAARQRSRPAGRG